VNTTLCYIPVCITCRYPGGCVFFAGSKKRATRAQRSTPDRPAREMRNPRTTYSGGVSVLCTSICPLPLSIFPGAPTPEDFIFPIALYRADHALHAAKRSAGAPKPRASTYALSSKPYLRKRSSIGAKSTCERRACRRIRLTGLSRAAWYNQKGDRCCSSETGGWYEGTQTSSGWLARTYLP
jgi:hypothetical protein